jgi:acyl-coenzyme A synthetase/AMP-(fatty) acid ligase
LKSVGVGKGDAVVIYLPMLMELPIAMLACARIGAVHSVTVNPHVCTSTVINGYMYS